MVKMIEMAEAHVANIRATIENLKNDKVSIDREIKKLESYLADCELEIENSKDS